MIGVMLLSQAEITTFQNTIFSWWENNRRDLPWRHTHDPYKILVSELMLQQTQVPRVIPKYAEFIEAYPSVFSLSTASTADLLRAWKGMGYNRRALYLKKTAETIVTQYNGIFPAEEEKLQKLPGLGSYTTRAILVFAFKHDVSMIDTNIRQIIVHFFFKDVPQKESEIKLVADQLVPKGKSWEWHQALMDYGSIEMVKIKKKSLKNNNVIARSHRRSNLVPQSKLPFKQTNRFFRGRVIDRLREGDIQEDHLYLQFEKEYKKEKQFMQQILEGLEKDGLVVREKGLVYLPK